MVGGSGCTRETQETCAVQHDGTVLLQPPPVLPPWTPEKDNKKTNDEKGGGVMEEPTDVISSVMITGTMPVKIEKTRGRGKDKIALPIEGQAHIMFSMNGEVHRFWGKVSLGGE